MVLLVTTLGGLHLLHWLVAFLIPFFLLLLFVVNRLLLRRFRLQTLEPLRKLTGLVDRLEGRAIENLEPLHGWMKRHAPQTACQAFERLAEDRDTLYQGRWVADPQVALPDPVWLSSATKSSLTMKAPAQWVALGLLATLIELVLLQVVPPQGASLYWFLLLLPLGSALILSLLTVTVVQHAKNTYADVLDAFYQAMGRKLPVFGQQTGVAALVDAYLTYDVSMQEQLQAFTEVTERLAAGDMADGVRRSVEHLLMESVGPSLQQASGTLGQLAEELTQRQAQGMEDLANQFAQALSSQLANQLGPMGRELGQMSALMADVKNYVEVALRAMDTTRSQTEAVQNTLNTSTVQLTVAQESMAENLAAIGTATAALSGAALELTGAYQQADATLGHMLDRLTTAFEASGQQVQQLGEQTTASVARAQELVADQRKIVEHQMAALDQHASLFSDQLKQSVQDLLSHMREDVLAVSERAAVIDRQFEALNRVLDQSVDRFEGASAAYVQQTLHQFDEHLAEVVTRLTQTAQEIQDAVDALPAAIQRSAQFGS